jgi:rhodanese-related sulfurtransferase
MSDLCVPGHPDVWGCRQFGTDVYLDDILPYVYWISAPALASRLGDLTVIDIRDEITDAPVPGSIHVPLDQLNSYLASLDRRTPLVFVCRRGNSVILANRAARYMGFDNVWLLEGGIAGWHEWENTMEGRWWGSMQGTAMQGTNTDGLCSPWLRIPPLLAGIGAVIYSRSTKKPFRVFGNELRGWGLFGATFVGAVAINWGIRSLQIASGQCAMGSTVPNMSTQIRPRRVTGTTKTRSLRSPATDTEGVVIYW